MNCTACGGDIPATAPGCPHCKTALQHSVAAGVLTPPPIDAQTRISAPAPAADSFDDSTQAPTRFVPPASDEGPRRAPAAEDTGPLTPGKPFGSRYHIIRLLGLGGMGAVYQAWDTELSVAVAIKVIRPEAMDNPAAAREIEHRFKRELLLAREVTHKNVVRIHDLGEIDRIKYITMSYIDGMDLASILKRDGKFPVAQALLTLRSVLPGLVAAHTAGVVHRDLKPANIMIGTHGDALIMDFGIAYSTREPDTGATEIRANLPEELRRSARTDGATLAGSVLGTVHYMAPEQARGEQVDQRADVYAVGLILYDMLLGRRRAAKADSAVGELEARMKQAPPSVRSVAPEIPIAVDAIVSRCLEPDPARRFQTTAELVAALDRLDENGEPLPVRRVVGLPLMAATVVVLVAIAAGVLYYQRQFIPPPVHDPVSVVIADFQNQTGDVTFDRTLEPMLKRALEGAGFISAYDRSALARTVGARLPEKLDQVAAREIAVKEGLGVVLSGVIQAQGAGYGVSVTATQTVTGEVIANVQGRAASKEQVLATATRLVSNVRQALGDETTESAQMFAMASLSATSLDVVREYAAAQDAASQNRFEDALQSALKAVELDPKFGIGYQLLAVASRNVGRQADAEKYINQALRYLDGMTERERFSTRGMFYRVTGDYQQCVKEYGDLLVRYAADVTGHNQLALCASQLRDMTRAMTEMRKVVELLPKRVVFRDNLALYTNYAGDFPAAEKEARAVDVPDAYAQLALAFAQMGQSQLPEANLTYQNMASIGALGASFSASGLGDLAVYEGRFTDAQRILERGAADDLAANNPNRAAAKFAALGYAHIMRGQKRPAIAAAQKALTNSSAVKIKFLAARVFIEAGDLVAAAPLMTGLASELQNEPQAYAKLLEGEIALQSKNLRGAIKLFTDANTLLDTWIGHFDLGRAYLEGNQLPQADSEFDRCLKRRGEALSLFLDEEPTFGFLPPVYYYQGRVREALQNDGFAEPYRTYLNVRGRAGEDPLLPEVRRRAGN